MNNLNKIVLLTGGSRGLGKEAALQLANNGFDVLITFQNNQVEAEKVVKDIRSLGRKSVSLQLDLTQTDSFDTFVSAVSKKLNWLLINYLRLA